MTRPEEMNAISPALIGDISAALSEAETDERVRVVVLTGTGNAFCAGADLKFVRSLNGDATAIVNQFLQPLSDLLRRLRQFRKPVIAAVNGHCVAGGLETVLCCDLVVAAQDGAVFCDGHSRYGLLPAVGGALGLARAVGPFKAKEMLFTGGRYTAGQMEAAGLVNRVVPDAELQAATDELVSELAQRSPLGLRRMKEMVNDGLELPWDVAARYELTVAERHLHSDVPNEGLLAFAERRAPRFGPEPR
jgi:enoyl-CoA hydratase/carnithine racemase